MTAKPPNHAIRVGTDEERHAYRERRVQQLRDDVMRRVEAAARVADDASVHIPRDLGFALCRPGAFGELSAVIQWARDVVARADLEAAKAAANKPFMVKLVKMDALGLDSPLLRFALRHDVIASVARYLGMVPILQYANVMYSSHAAAEPAKSQLYHCDSDEVEQVKVFVLCEEVTAETGPLTFVPAWQSQQIRRHTMYRYKTRLADDTVRAAAVGSLQEVALTGPPGTAVFLDTSRCLHYGSRFADPSARRIVVMLQYITPLAFILPDYPHGTTFAHLHRGDQEELVSLVLGSS